MASCLIKPNALKVSPSLPRCHHLQPHKSSLCLDYLDHRLTSSPPSTTSTMPNVQEQLIQTLETKGLQFHIKTGNAKYKCTLIDRATHERRKAERTTSSSAVSTTTSSSSSISSGFLCLVWNTPHLSLYTVYPTQQPSTSRMEGGHIARAAVANHPPGRQGAGWWWKLTNGRERERERDHPPPPRCWDPGVSRKLILRYPGCNFGGGVWSGSRTSSMREWIPPPVEGWKPDHEGAWEPWFLFLVLGLRRRGRARARERLLAFRPLPTPSSRALVFLCFTRPQVSSDWVFREHGKAGKWFFLIGWSL
ncbi:hypothetical protein VTJ83DRAFT_4974 [Remersonia thermophila]|uniref:Uncharacterized protein n=1 Tax=Remersonia thermophila TaxID=72144 RepID=A0ABR4DBG8_9PEZI